MKIAIEGRVLSARGGGVKTYVAQLVRRLGEVFPADEFRVWTTTGGSTPWPPSVAEEVVPLRHEIFLTRWLRVKVLPKMMQWRPDVVHFTKAAVPSGSSVPAVVTIYDVIPLLLPSSQVWSRRWYWPRTLRQAAARASHVITISEASKQDIVRHLGIPPERVTVTPLAADLDHFQVRTKGECMKKIASKYEIPPPYLLYVGTIEPRKNIPLLLRAFARVASDIPHTLIIAGKLGMGYAAVMREVRRVKVPPGRVRFLDFVAHDDLPALYGGSDAFVWPSLYEGWGLPPLEAMACGVPTVVSDGGALPEVVGDAGVVVPFAATSLEARLHDVDFELRLSQAIVSLVLQPDRLHAMRAAGRARAETFSWKAVAESTYDVYRRVIRSSV